MPKIVARKEDWITLGFQLFSETGTSGIVIEKMARTLKVNKSSFYWHFKTKKDFFNEIISYWVKKDTNGIIESVERKKTADAKFRELIKFTFRKDPYQDFFFFLKRYALKDKKTLSLIDEIDDQRINYTNNILLEMGIPENEAQIKATLFYKYLIGYHEMIRYKKQPKNYVSEVEKELSEFIDFNNG